MQDIPFGIKLKANEGNAVTINMSFESGKIGLVYCFLCLDPSGNRYFFRFDEDARQVAEKIPGWEYIG